MTRHAEGQAQMMTWRVQLATLALMVLALYPWPPPISCCEVPIYVGHVPRPFPQPVRGVMP